MADKPLGRSFQVLTFCRWGTRAAEDQALFRMMSAEIIKRVTRGLYAKAGQRMEAQTIAHALAQKTGEQTRLAPAEGTDDLLVVPTSGLSRTVKAAGHTAQFCRMSQRKVQLAATPKGRILLVLWTRGMPNLTKLEIQGATGDWA